MNYPKDSKYKHLFGPVHSRRLGISLGVNMILFKVCSLDCVYCECGKTTEVTIERKEYIDYQELVDELSDYLSQKPRLDYVTFAGSGEPTLNTALGKCIRYVNKIFPEYKTALLTNGTIFYDPEVRSDCLPCDLVLPSIDAISDKAFLDVNRPNQKLDNKIILDGLVAFSREYTGKLWIEVFIVPGVNDNPDELHAFKKTLTEINPTRVQLNSLDRPGACDWVKVATPESLKKIADFLSPLPVEIISRNSRDIQLNPITAETDEEALYNIIKYRPSTIEEIACSAGMTINNAIALLDKMIQSGKITTGVTNNNTFYKSV